MTDFQLSAPLDRFPLALLLSWHTRVFKEFYDAVRAGDFDHMYKAHYALEELRFEIQSRLIDGSRGERSEYQRPADGGLHGLL